MFRYYVPFQFQDGFGWRFIERETPLDSEESIREAHLALEQDLGFPIVILTWKRID